MSVKSPMVAVLLSAIKLIGSAERTFTVKASRVLLPLLEMESDEMRSAWRKLNSEAYAALKLRKGMPEYAQFSKWASMLLKVAIVAPDVVEEFAKGNYKSLQVTYTLLSNKSRKAAGGKSKKLSAVERHIRFLSALSGRELNAVAKAWRKTLAAVRAA